MVRFADPDSIRSAFSAAMSDMYRKEVPLYGNLLNIVADTNRAALVHSGSDDPAPMNANDPDRLNIERHGAIRVGTPNELRQLARLFAIMGMYPVGYYDLSIAGVPVHSTAFRPITPAALSANPFRLFTSLLRLELILDKDLRDQSFALLKKRHIISDQALALTERAEIDGGLSENDAAQFVQAVLESFRWHADAQVDIATYEALSKTHPLIADIVCFKGPHINHLTPRTLDIDAAQQAMQAEGMDAKSVIEGPPRRRTPILLRQTSFKALTESIHFTNGAGTHSARFGEIEQRGIALTPKGRELYDHCLQKARGDSDSASRDYAERLNAAFSDFPDDWTSLRLQGLAYFEYRLSKKGHGGHDLESWMASGRVEAHPIIYEDFLPVSAAGIFQSNLGGAEQNPHQPQASQNDFEQALGKPVQDPFSLYAAQEAASITFVTATLSKAS